MSKYFPVCGRKRTSICALMSTRPSRIQAGCGDFLATTSQLSAGLGGAGKMVLSCMQHGMNREWTMKILTILSVSFVLATTSVDAQVNVTAPQGGAFGIDPTMRVSTTFRVTVVPVETQTISDPKPQETARRTLYRMAEDECAALSDVFQSECRLGSLSIANPVVPNIVSAMMTATAVYELRPRGHHAK